MLLTQEVLGNNAPYAYTRANVTSDSSGKSTLIEKAEPYKFDTPKYVDDREAVVSIRSISSNGAVGPFSHFLTIPPVTESRLRRLARIQLPM